MNRKRPALRAARCLAVCYVLAAAVWVLRCLMGSGVMLNYKLSGRMPTRTLTLDDLHTESLVPYTAQDGWLVSSDADPHLIWEGTAYVENVTLRADYGLPPGSVALYWRGPDETEYRESQKVFARQDADGGYTFALGGRLVGALRIDPDSLGGVPIRVRAVELNPAAPWYRRFLPGGGAWLLLLFGPVLAAALWRALLPGDEKD